MSEKGRECGLVEEPRSVKVRKSYEVVIVRKGRVCSVGSPRMTFCGLSEGC